MIAATRWPWSQAPASTGSAPAAAGAAPFAGFKLAAPASTAAVPAAGTSTESAAEPSEEYYKQLRGLNRSFMSHLQAEVAKDEFVDLSISLDKYREYRADIVKKHGPGSAAATAPKVADAAKPADAAKSPDAGKPAEPAAAPSKPAFSLTTPFTLPTPAAAGDAAKPGAAPAAPAFKLPPLQFGGTGGTGGSSLPSFSLFGSGSTSTPLFGAPAANAPAKAAGADGDDGEGGGEDDDDDGPIPAEEPTKPDQFKKGAGEEDEDTLLELEGVKLFEFQKAANKWQTIGAGLLRINENRTSKKRRILSRSDGVGQVLLNTNLFSGMTATEVPDAKTPSVRMLCALPDKGIVQVLVRLPSKADAAKLVSAIEKYRPA